MLDWAARRAVRFFLQKSLGPFLKDDVSLDSLDVRMRDGTVHVRNLQLNCAHINTLPSLTPLGLSFEEGLVGCVSLQLPGLLNRSAADDGDATPVPAGTRVHLEELLLCVRVLERESGPHTAAAAAAASGDACNTAAPAEATPFTAGVRHALSTWLSEAEGKAPVRGAQMLATWIDALLKGLDVSLTTARIRVILPPLGAVVLSLAALTLPAAPSAAPQTLTRKLELQGFKIHLEDEQAPEASPESPTAAPSAFTTPLTDRQSFEVPSALALALTPATPEPESGRPVEAAPFSGTDDSDPEPSAVSPFLARAHESVPAPEPLSREASSASRKSDRQAKKGGKSRPPLHPVTTTPPQSNFATAVAAKALNRSRSTASLGGMSAASEAGPPRSTDGWESPGCLHFPSAASVRSSPEAEAEAEAAASPVSILALADHAFPGTELCVLPLPYADVDADADADAPPYEPGTALQVANALVLAAPRRADSGYGRTQYSGGGWPEDPPSEDEGEASMSEAEDEREGDQPPFSGPGPVRTLLRGLWGLFGEEETQILNESEVLKAAEPGKAEQVAARLRREFEAGEPVPAPLFAPLSLSLALSAAVAAPTSTFAALQLDLQLSKLQLELAFDQFARLAAVLARLAPPSSAPAAATVPSRRPPPAFSVRRLCRSVARLLTDPAKVLQSALGAAVLQTPAANAESAPPWKTAAAAERQRNGVAAAVPPSYDDDDDALDSALEASVYFDADEGDWHSAAGSILGLDPVDAGGSAAAVGPGASPGLRVAATWDGVDLSLRCRSSCTEGASLQLQLGAITATAWRPVTEAGEAATALDLAMTSVALDVASADPCVDVASDATLASALTHLPAAARPAQATTGSREALPLLSIAAPHGPAVQLVGTVARAHRSLHVSLAPLTLLLPTPRLAALTALLDALPPRPPASPAPTPAPSPRAVRPPPLHIGVRFERAVALVSGCSAVSHVLAASLGGPVIEAAAPAASLDLALFPRPDRLECPYRPGSSLHCTVTLGPAKLQLLAPQKEGEGAAAWHTKDLAALCPAHPGAPAGTLRLDVADSVRIPADPTNAVPSSDPLSGAASAAPWQVRAGVLMAASPIVAVASGGTVSLHVTPEDAATAPAVLLAKELIDALVSPQQPPRPPLPPIALLLRAAVEIEIAGKAEGSMPFLLSADTIEVFAASAAKTPAAPARTALVLDSTGATLALSQRSQPSASTPSPSPTRETRPPLLSVAPWTRDISAAPSAPPSWPSADLTAGFYASTPLPSSARPAPSAAGLHVGYESGCSLPSPALVLRCQGLTAANRPGELGFEWAADLARLFQRRAAPTAEAEVAALAPVSTDAAASPSPAPRSLAVSIELERTCLAVAAPGLLGVAALHPALVVAVDALRFHAGAAVQAAAHAADDGWIRPPAASPSSPSSSGASALPSWRTRVTGARALIGAVPAASPDPAAVWTDLLHLRARMWAAGAAPCAGLREMIAEGLLVAERFEGDPWKLSLRNQGLLTTLDRETLHSGAALQRAIAQLPPRPRPRPETPAAAAAAAAEASEDSALHLLLQSVMLPSPAQPSAAVSNGVLQAMQSSSVPVQAAAACSTSSAASSTVAEPEYSVHIHKPSEGGGAWLAGPPDTARSAWAFEDNPSSPSELGETATSKSSMSFSYSDTDATDAETDAESTEDGEVVHLTAGPARTAVGPPPPPPPCAILTDRGTAAAFEAEADGAWLLPSAREVPSPHEAAAACHGGSGSRGGAVHVASGSTAAQADPWALLVAGKRPCGVVECKLQLRLRLVGTTESLSLPEGADADDLVVEEGGELEVAVVGLSITLQRFGEREFVSWTARATAADVRVLNLAEPDPTSRWRTVLGRLVTGTEQVGARLAPKPRTKPSKAVRALTRPFKDAFFPASSSAPPARPFPWGAGSRKASPAPPLVPAPRPAPATPSAAPVALALAPGPQANFFELEVYALCPEHRAPERDRPPAPELLARVRLHPIRIHLDQYLLQFIIAMADCAAAPAAAGGGGVSAPSIPHPRVAAAARPAAPRDVIGVNTLQQTSGPFLQRLELAPCRLRLDYKPRRANLRKFVAGADARALLEVLNIVPVCGLVLKFPPVSLVGASGLPEVAERVGSAYLDHISRTQAFKFVEGLPALHSATRIARAAKQVVEAPMWGARPRPPPSTAPAALLDAAMLSSAPGGNDATVSDAASNLLRAIASEVLNLGINLAAGAEFVLQGGSVPDQSAPRTAAEGLTTGAERLARGMEAAFVALSSPVYSIQRGESLSVAVARGIRAAPEAGRMVVSGASAALKAALQGARNQIDRDRI